MKIKKYVVDDIKEAISLIRKDLGDDAVIVNQQLVSAPGFFSFLKKKKLEVTAAIDDKVTASKAEFKPRTHGRYEEQLKPKEPDTFINDMLFTTDDVSKLIKEPVQKAENMKPEKKDVESNFKPGLFTTEKKPTINTINHQPQQAKNYNWENELNHIKSMIENMATTTTSTQVIDVNQQLSQAITSLLVDYDFSIEFTTAWHQHLLTVKPEQRVVSLESLYEFVKHEIQHRVCIKDNSDPRIQVFVGPPGVGKTTTIAKIASNEIINNQRRVGMITVDTYRIGAVEQLKTYASILNIPIKVVYNQADMRQAIEELQGCDRIIIDSMGRTHRDQENLAELKALFEPIKEYDCYLVLSMSMKYRQLIRIMEKYQFLNYNHLVLTKLDESERNENILNIAYDYSYPIAYLCTGQEVPTDIELPNFNRILELIWGGNDYA